jgi:predicted deacylase
MPIKPIRLGPHAGKPGQLVYTHVTVMDLPTGGAERIPLIIAQGRREGPCLWITTGIHGPEHTGLNVMHQVVTPALARRLRGTVVAIPALNPAGLRTAERRPYYVHDDPNRLFPHDQPPDSDEPPSALEQTYARIYGWIKSSADYLIDMHNAWVGSLPFVFRDRVWYRGEDQRPAAEDLLARTDALIAALGFSAVNEFEMKKYVQERLHRSVSGAALNDGRIPAVTLELGTGITPEPAIVAAGVTALHNVLKWAGMLPGRPEPLSGVPLVHAPFPVRRHMGPRAPRSGIVRCLAHPGQHVRVGQPVATLCDIFGRPIGDGLLHSAHDGWIISATEGVVRYPGEPVLVMAIRDDAPLVAPYPEKTS